MWGTVDSASTEDIVFRRQRTCSTGGGGKRNERLKKRRRWCIGQKRKNLCDRRERSLLKKKEKNLKNSPRETIHTEKGDVNRLSVIRLRKTRMGGKLAVRLEETKSERAKTSHHPRTI